MTVNLPVASNLYPQRWTLSSPPFVTTTPTCLNLTFTTNVYFAVHLSCVYLNRTYEDRLLYRASELNSEGVTFILQELSFLYVNVNEMSSTYAQCALVFEIISIQAGDLAVIYNVQLLPGKCRPNNGNIVCDLIWCNFCSLVATIM